MYNYGTAVCDGEVDEGVDWHDVEPIIGTIKMECGSHPGLYGGDWCGMRGMKVPNVQTGIWLSIFG